MSKNNKKIETAIIAGAGISGLAAALAFRRIGWNAIVVEQASKFGAVGAGILLQANGIISLNALGLGNKVRALGVPLRRLKMHGRRGVTYFTTDYGLALPPELYLISIRRADLHRILEEECTNAGVQFKLGHKVTGVQKNEHQQYSLQCESAEGDSQLIKGSLIIGADGVRSVVREGSGIESRFQSIVEGSIHGVVPFELEENLHGAYFGRGEGSGLFPIHGGKTFWFWGRRGETVGELTSQNFPIWKKHIITNFPVFKKVLSHYSDMNEISLYLHRSIRCERWQCGNLALIGDAAHAMSPSVGQGANSGLVDAVSIACHLINATSFEDIMQALQHFENERRPKVEMFQNTGDRGGVFGTVNGPMDEFVLKLKLALARFTSDSTRRGLIRHVTGLTAEGYDLASVGLSTSIPITPCEQWRFK